MPCLYLCGRNWSIMYCNLFLFYSLVSHAILIATNQPACNKNFFTLYCDISTHQWLEFYIWCGCSMFATVWPSQKKASTTHCLIRKYHNLQTCGWLLNIQGKLKLICKMSVILASCQTGCKCEPVQTKRIRFLMLKSLILLHTLLSSKNTSPSSKHPPPSLPTMYNV